MKQIGLFPGKSEGPHARPPVPTRSNHIQKVYKEDTTISRKRKAASRARMKVKTLRAQTGRHRYLVLYGKVPVLLGRDEFRTVGDARGAGKAKARQLAYDRKEIAFMPVHTALDGCCHACLRAGQMRKAVTMDNAGTPGSLCRACWEERHPGQLQRWGVA